ncbi:DUF6890 family protein [Aurantiacibacter zhengii]
MGTIGAAIWLRSKLSQRMRSAVPNGSQPQFR